MTLSEQLRTEDPSSPSSPPPRGARRGRRIVLAVAVLVALAAIVFVGVRVVQGLTEKQPRRSGTNSVFPSEPVARLARGQTLCQIATVPRGTATIEIPFEGAALATGTRLEVRDQSSKRVVARANPGPVRARATRYTLSRPLPADVDAQVCLRQLRGRGDAILGSREKTGLELNGGIVGGAISMAYYRPGEERLISLLPEIARRIGRTRGHLGGAWRGAAILVLFGGAVGLSAWLLVGLARGRARPRRVAVVVALVAGFNALAWGMLTPVFQTPDETFHTSYVQDLAEHGKPPRAAKDGLSQEMYAIIDGAQVGAINFNPFGRGRWSPDAEARLDKVLASKPNPDNPRASANVRDYPPAYYGGLVPAYVVTHAAGGSTLDALTFMRAIGALFAMITVLALLAMLRELFPDRPLLTGGVALIVGFQPVFTWISGGVNPDAALIPTGAVLFWLIVRAQRRGLTVPLAAGIGLVAALAGLIKLAGLGLVPGAALAVVLLLWKNAPAGRLRPALAAAAGFGIPALIYLVLMGLVWNLPIVPNAVGDAAAAPTGRGDRRSLELRHVRLAVLPAAHRRDDGLLPRRMDAEGLLDAAVRRPLRLVRLRLPAQRQQLRVRGLRRGRGGGARRARPAHPPRLADRRRVRGAHRRRARSRSRASAIRSARAATSCSSRPATCCRCSGCTPSRSGSRSRCCAGARWWRSPRSRSRSRRCTCSPRSC